MATWVGFVCLLLLLGLLWWYLGRVHVWIEETPVPTFDVEAFLRAHCFPRMRPLRGQSPDKTWFVARRAGRVVGCAALSKRDGYFLLHYDCVHPAHRGRGVGRGCTGRGWRAAAARMMAASRCGCTSWRRTERPTRCVASSRSLSLCAGLG